MCISKERSKISQIKNKTKTNLSHFRNAEFDFNIIPEKLDIMSVKRIISF